MLRASAQGSTLKHLTGLRTLDVDLNDVGDDELRCRLDGLPGAMQDGAVSGGTRDMKIFTWPEPTPKMSIQLKTLGELTLIDAAGRLPGCHLELQAQRMTIAGNENLHPMERAVDALLHWVSASGAASVLFEAVSYDHDDGWLMLSIGPGGVTSYERHSDDEVPLMVQQLQPRCERHGLSCCTDDDGYSIHISRLAPMRER